MNTTHSKTISIKDSILNNSYECYQAVMNIFNETTDYVILRGEIIGFKEFMTLPDRERYFNYADTRSVYTPSTGTCAHEILGTVTMVIDDCAVHFYQTADFLVIRQEDYYGNRTTEPTNIHHPYLVSFLLTMGKRGAQKIKLQQYISFGVDNHAGEIWGDIKPHGKIPLLDKEVSGYGNSSVSPTDNGDWKKKFDELELDTKQRVRELEASQQRLEEKNIQLGEQLTLMLENIAEISKEL